MDRAPDVLSAHGLLVRPRQRCTSRSRPFYPCSSAIDYGQRSICRYYGVCGPFTIRCLCALVVLLLICDSVSFFFSGLSVCSFLPFNCLKIPYYLYPQFNTNNTSSRPASDTHAHVYPSITILTKPESQKGGGGREKEEYAY